MVTAEEARAELARRRAASATITPEMARAELERRRAMRAREIAPAQRAAPLASPAPSQGGSVLDRINEWAGRQLSTPGASDSFLGGIADTLSFGLMDEAVAGASALLRRPFSDKDVGTLYRESLGRQRERAAQEDAAHPTARLAGQIGGGLLLGGTTAPLTMSGRAAASGAPLLTRVGAGAVDAGAAGAAYGAGSADDRQSRGEGAVRGGAFGAMVGMAFPLLGAGASAAYRNVRNALSAKPLARSAGANLETLRTLGNVIEADDLAGAGRANMARAGSEAMLVDAGPTAQSVLDTAIQRGGPGARLARERIQGRVARDSAALTGALDNALGQPQGVNAARAAIREGTATARQEAYEAAYAAPIDYASDVGRRIEEIVRNRVPASAIQRANQLMRAEGAQSQQIAARVADDGTVTFERLPDVRQIDYITRALNDVAEAGEGAGAMGGMSALGRVYANLSRELRSSLRQAVPEYGKALEVAADPIRRSQAVKLGSQILSPRMTRDEVAEAVSGMTGPERDALAQGVRSQIDDLMARVTRTIGDDDMAAREAIAALRNLSSRANREKLAVALGEERVAPMLQEIDRAAQSFNIRAALTGNSRTYGRQATAQMVQDMSAPGAVGTLMRGEPVNAAKRVIQALTGQTDDVLRARQDAIYSEIADLLTRPGGPDQSVFQAVQGLNQTDALTRAVADRLNRGISSPLLSYPAATQLIDRQP